MQVRGTQYIFLCSFISFMTIDNSENLSFIFY